MGILSRGHNPNPDMEAPMPEDIELIGDKEADEETPFEQFLIYHDADITDLGEQWNLVRQDIEESLDFLSEGKPEEKNLEVMAFNISAQQRQASPMALKISGRNTQGARAQVVAPNVRQLNRFGNTKALGLAEDHMKRAVIGARLTARSILHDDRPGRYEAPYNQAAVRTSISMPQGEEDNRSPEEVILDYEESFYHPLVAKFSVIEGINARLLADTAAHLRTSPQHMLDFIDWLNALDDAQSEHYSPYLQLLATDTFDDQADHTVPGVIKEYEAESGEFLKEAFWGDVLDNPVYNDKGQLKAWFEYLGVMKERFGIDDEAFKAFVLETQASWPPELQDAYRRFNSTFFQDVQQLLKTSLQQHRRKMQRLPTYNDYVACDDRLQVEQRSIGRPDLGVKASKGSKKQRTSVGNTSDFIERKQQPQKSEIVVGILVPKGNDSFDFEELDNAAFEAFSSRIINAFPNEKKLPDDIKKMIDSLKETPFGTGTTYRKDLPRIIVNSQRIALRRLSPLRRPGLSVGETAKSLRLTYVTFRDKQGRLVVALEDIRSHEEYDRLVQKSHIS